LQVVRGDSAKVLSRVLQAFGSVNASRGFLIRGDTPFISPDSAQSLFESHIRSEADYSYAEHLLGLPYGLGVEIVERAMLEKLSGRTVGNLTQNFSSFLRLHSDNFTINRKEFDFPDPDLRFAVEYPEDLDFAQELFSLVSNEGPEVADLLDAISHHPYLKRINRPKEEIRETGLEKILLFPEKIHSITTQSRDPSYPISVELSLTNECNLNCEWCSDKQLRKNRPGTLPYARFCNLVDDLAAHGTRGLVLEGGGEPTLYPRFRDAVQYAVERGLAVGLITNGVLFEYEDILPRMEWVRVSLDADTAEVFHRCKGKNEFHHVLENIRRMCECKGSCTIGIGYVVNKHNLAHLEDITLILSDYGADYLHLRPVIDHPDLRIDHDLLYLKKYEAGSFRVLIHAMNENTVTGNNGLPCIAHSVSSVITADGSVFLCGRLNIHDWCEPIGNLNNASFHEIWTGHQRQQQSLQVTNPDFCRKWCPECRMTKYNILFSQSQKIRTRNFI
jgi:MoaA/NifB/PqqE/SkfB family radical SAM enzyme/spore coat polysaccharide biosynthesis protein SpsF (cytidylyltransferase family)